MQKAHKETRSSTNRKKSSRFNRFSDNLRNKKQFISRNPRKKRKNTSNVSFLTANSLKVISALEMDYFFGEGLFQNGVTPTELIKKLYPIMREDLDVFLHTEVFNEETEPIHFLNWMLQFYEELHYEPQWLIEDDGRGKYHVYRIYDYGNDEMGSSVGLQFMPQIKEENKIIYGFLTGALKLLIGYGIPFYWHDDELEYAIDMVEGDIEEYKADLKDLDNVGDEECSVPEENRPERRKEIKEYMRDTKRCLKEYKNGAVAQTQKDIEGAKFSKLKYKKFIARTPLEEVCKTFIDNILIFIDEYSEDNLMRYIHLHKNESEEGMPIMPDKYCQVGWAFDDDDLVSDKMSMLTQSTWNEYGSVPFRYMQVDDKESEISMMPFAWIELLSYLQRIADKCR